jgi:hypothetical protein
MPLSILLVGRGEGEPASVANGHRLEFWRSARTQSGIASLNDFDFVLLHANNPEAAEAVEKWEGEGWVRKVVLISGGSVGASWTESKLPALENVTGRNGVLALNWSSVAAEFVGDNWELVETLRAPFDETLTALAILCQGYLATHAKRDQNGCWEPTEIQGALMRMGWMQLVGPTGKLGDTLLADVSLKSSETESREWWVKVLGEDRRKTERQIAREWGEGSMESCPAAVRTLMEAIYERQHPIVPLIVADAYCAIADKFEGADRPSE